MNGLAIYPNKEVVMRIIFLLTCMLLSAQISLSDNLLLKQTNPQSFIDQAPSPEREAIVSFITHQFDDWRSKGVTQAQLNKVWNNDQVKRDLLMARFQVVDQKLYADCYNVTRPYFRALLGYLQKLVLTHKIQDVDFIVNIVDIMELPMPDNIPSFVMSRNIDSSKERDRFLIPDAFMLGDNWASLIQNVEQASINNPWQQKTNKIFWRGSLSGSNPTGNNDFSMENIDKFPRLNLAILSKLYPDMIDAESTNRVSAYTKGGRDIEEAMQIILGSSTANTPPAEHIKYRYLASIDGATCAWQRVPWIMLSNSVLLKQETSFMEWFYPAIKPYVHYVPMDERLTNIFQQLKWMQAHDSEVQEISRNATSFVKNELMPEHIKDHMAIILNEYSSVHKAEKLVPTLPPAEETMDRADKLASQGLTISQKFTHGFRKFKYEFKKLWW